VLQGALKLSDKATINAALEKLYELEAFDRPLGQGVVGETVKGSLNVLEALWPKVQAGQKLRIRAMMDALLQAHVRANTVGIIVAIDHEADAAKKAFSDVGASITTSGDTTMVVEHANYRAVVCQGKALVGVGDVTRTLLMNTRQNG